jgi:Nif-specific regulatory protein
MVSAKASLAVMATAQPIIVQDIDAEPQFLMWAVARQLPQDVVAFTLPIEVNREVIYAGFASHCIRRDRQLTTPC